MTAHGFPAFLGLAAGLHLAAAALWLPPLGGGGGGDGGAAAVSVRASKAVAELVAEWETPPDASQVPLAPRTPRIPAAEPTTDIPAPEQAVTRDRADVLPLPAPAPPPVARAETQARLPVPPAVGETVTRPSTSAEAPRPTAPEPLANASLASALPDLNSALPPEAPARAAPQVSSRPSSRPVLATPSRRAAGAGPSETRGRSSIVATGPSAAQKAEAEATWAAAIQRRVARYQRYPAGRHGSGRARITMTILPSGQLSALSLDRSSGTDALDRAALDAARRAAPFPKAPSVLTESSYRVSQWVGFEG